MSTMTAGVVELPPRQGADAALGRPCDRDAPVVMDEARLMLTALGFAVDREGEDQLKARSPGLQSTRQNPLLTASTLWLQCRQGRLELHADLGGLRWMRKFVLYFPIGMGTVGAAVMLALRLPAHLSMIPLAATAPWVVLAPMMAKWWRRGFMRKAGRFLDNLSAGN